MEVRSENNIQVRCDKILSVSILLWTCLIHLVAVGKLWHPRLLTGLTNRISFFHPPFSSFSTLAAFSASSRSSRLENYDELIVGMPVILLGCQNTVGNYKSNGFLRVSCNGGLNQMRAVICDMVTVAQLLNLTLVVPELDKTSFWSDPSDFEDIFDVRHFIDSLKDEVRIVKRLPKRFSRNHGFEAFRMSPVSWSNEKYYLEQVLPLFSKYKVVHFNKTDTRWANNGISLELQKIRCRVNFEGLEFTPEIETLGCKLVRILQEKGPFLVLHLRYEMDMLAFSGCTHGCTVEEAEELKRMRYAYPWWREKEIVSEARRQQGLCPLRPEEAVLILQALGFDKETQIYIASGEIYGGERRLAPLRAAFPRIVKKETLLDQVELQQFQNHSSQMAAWDFMVSIASNIFIPHMTGTWQKLSKVIAGTYIAELYNKGRGYYFHGADKLLFRYLGFKKSNLPDRKKLVELVDLYQNGTLSWSDFALAVKQAHEN
ncbi:hypothetical protein DITRI_Ditri09bG0044100 [Diplodiscus trichospermus]